VLEWNEAFEQAGFSNAMQVRVAPTEEEDPEFSLLDARYSVIRYVATRPAPPTAAAMWSTPAPARSSGRTPTCITA
jgi:hypothetical protein